MCSMVCSSCFGCVCGLLLFVFCFSLLFLFVVCKALTRLLTYFVIHNAVACDLCFSSVFVFYYVFYDFVCHFCFNIICVMVC